MVKSPLKSNNTYSMIYQIIRKVPKGKVATYGQIAFLVGIPRGARQVGYALHSLPDGSDVPWQRIINSRGKISYKSASFFENIQYQLLVSEGIIFEESGKIDLQKFQWNPTQI